MQFMVLCFSSDLFSKLTLFLFCDLQLIASEFSEGLGLGSCADFDYISCSACRTVEGLDDSAEFDVTMSAMRSVGMKNAQIKSVLSLVAAVLHLGE